jgi:hypothetical protein
MKKIGLLCLAIVLALGALGVGYASWSDTIFVKGTVQTGEVCFSIDPDRISEIDACPDQVWSTWVYDGFTDSCPNGYHFTGIADAPHGKCPATVTFSPMQADGTPIAEQDLDTIPIEKLGVTIHDAYPHLLVHVSIYVCNCGTIPIIIQAPTIEQSDFLVIEYGDNIGAQVHPGVCKEISFYVGVVQHRGYFAIEGDPSSYVVDNESQDILPMNSSDELVEDVWFTIEIPAKQWAECPEG